MFERFATGFHLARQSWDVLKTDKHLLVFPLLSGICCLFVLASFAVPLLLSGVLEQVTQAGVDVAESGDSGEVAPPSNPIYWAGLFAFYFSNYFVIVFFNSALIACAVKRFYGERPTISEGLSASMARLPQIAGWAFVSATVGIALRLIESRSERVGQFVVGLLGMGWSAVTFFVVPVLVIERLGPIDAVKRSTQILKSSWGEALAGNSSIGFFSFLAMLPCIGLVVAGAVAAGNQMIVIGITLVAIGSAGLLIVSLVSSALSAIIQAAVYMYGASGQAPAAFDSSTLRAAFRRA
ncbi:DUF6159 family protein [Allorhodopirellula heiligendammensis]|uniref:Glycerophosphoryl diester phosphodiesterase membrane domain-containing protein n=1 Tax=Allorhodopirellula heiligendammensis TaxID=2714739 RepID=A0A5C6C5K2_9BACT|nr:DUF6159 family protein [Allorhodopirellula heiligendammensis]TWU19395.1 hypothetical protein Poly21_15680 [Allorhodopirellula heiligendammensis]